MTPPPTKRDGASPNLDFLRSVAVLVVLADHIGQALGIAHEDSVFLILGRWGVLLFFVHTSLVLMLSLERLRLDGWALARTFYVRRIFRIYPLAIVAITAAIVWHIPASFGGPYESPSTLTVVSNYLLAQNLTLSPSVLGPLWSLPYEVQMYLVLPLVFLVIRPNLSVGRIAALWIASVAVGLLQAKLMTIPGTGAWRMRIAEFAPCFLAGVMAYQISRSRPRSPLPAWAWILVIAAVSVVFVAWQKRLLTPDGFANYPQWIACLAVGLAVNACREIPWSAFNWLTHRIAKYSYGIYLGQVPIIWLVFEKLPGLGPALQWPLFALLIVAIPVASFHLIEDPMIRAGAKWAARFRGTPSVASPPGGMASSDPLPAQGDPRSHTTRRD